MSHIQRALLAILTLTLCLTSHTTHAWDPYLELDGRLFNFQNGGGGLMWIPLRQKEQDLIFLQGRFGFYRGYLFSESIGAGYRRTLSPNFALGINTFLDIAESKGGPTYYQGGLGLEALGNCFEARINGYAPTIKTTRIGRNGIVIGNEVVYRDDLERSFGGLDAEIGAGFGCGPGDIWAYAAYYGFFHDKVDPIQGPRLRAEYRWYDPLGYAGVQVVIGGEYSYDRVHKSEGALIGSIRIPLAGRRRFRSCASPRLYRRLSDPVRRQQSIWVERFAAGTKDAGGNQAIANIFFVTADGTGSGTQKDPTSLENALQAAGPNDFIFLLANSGPVLVEKETLSLEEGQTLASFGSSKKTLLVLPEDGICPVTDTTEAGTATLQGGISTVTMASNSSIRGLTIKGFDERAITADEAERLTIKNVQIDLEGRNTTGISLRNTSGQLTIEKNLLKNGGEEAVPLLIQTHDGELQLTSNTIKGGAIAKIANLNDTFNIEHNTFDHVTRGLSIEQSEQPNELVEGAIKGNTFQNGQRAFQYGTTTGPEDGQTHVRFTDNTIENMTTTGPAVEALFAGSQAHTFSASNNTLKEVNADKGAINITDVSSGEIRSYTSNNTFEKIDGVNVALTSLDGKHHTVIANNTDTDSTGETAIFVDIRGKESHATITNNTSDRDSGKEIVVVEHKNGLKLNADKNDGMEVERSTP